MFKIITVPDSVLRTVSKPISKIDRKTKSIIHSLGETLVNKTDPPGVGISAVQIGKPIRLFYTLMPSDNAATRDNWDKNNLDLKMYINPQIVSASKKITLGDDPQKPIMEGCLSIPHIWGPVWRHQWVKIKYQQLDDNDQLIDVTEKFTNFPARVIQHEYDHLEGILFTDYVRGRSPSGTFRSLGEVTQLYFDQEDNFVPIKDPSKIVTW